MYRLAYTSFKTLSSPPVIIQSIFCFISKFTTFLSNDIFSLITQVMVTIGSELLKGYHLLRPIKSVFLVFYC